MAHQEVSPLSKRFTILIGLGVVSAMSFGLSISFYRNLLFEETLSSLSERNRALRDKIDDGLLELAYYRSLQYRDKYAKESLGKLNTGEKVLILSEKPKSIFAGEDQNASYFEQRDVVYQQYLRSIPVVEHWRLYLFEPEELKRLKESF
jgi:hypothetical protein